MLFGSIAILSGAVILDDGIHTPSDLQAIEDIPIVVSVPNRRQFRQVLNN